MLTNYKKDKHNSDQDCRCNLHKEMDQYSRLITQKLESIIFCGTLILCLISHIMQVFSVISISMMKPKLFNLASHDLICQPHTYSQVKLSFPFNVIYTVLQLKELQEKRKAI